ncbi:MAG: acyl carrier protein [Sphingobacteriales bacterium]|jgi:acyl carrier protein
MSNKVKLFESFAAALNIPVESVTEELSYQGIPEWDSISHMVLISQLEEDFGVSIATDDVIDMSSVAKAMDILGKQGISF